MTTYTYEFTAFTEEALLSAGSGNGSNLGYGDSFTMPASADTTFVVTDNDPYLSGDSWNNENANDSSYQTASIIVDGEEAGNGGQVYGEQYFWVYGSSGNWYLMIEIEQEGTGDDYFTFYNAYGVPEEGETLTVSCGGNISCWQPHMGCLESPPATTPPVAVLDAITITEGEAIGDSNDDAQLNILANDFDTDGTISLTGVNGAQPGDVVTVTTDRGQSVDVTVDANGNLFFDTGSDFDSLLDGETDSFELTYTITDNDGNIATSTVTVTIEGESGIDAQDDEYTVLETEGAGDFEGNVLDNDSNDFGMVDAVLRVNGQEANVGEWIDLDGGGRVRLMENGELDFDANGDFDFLAEGQTAMQNLTYTIAQMGEGSNDEYQCLFFGGHAAGTIIDDQYASNGVTISGYRSHDAGMSNPPNAVMIFDTSNPTGGDFDLSSSTRGNVLIITEDFDGSDPDDEAHGGTFVFDFDREADVESLVMLDTEEPAPEIRLYDEAGNLITTIIGPVTTDGGEGIANINVDGVHRMEVELQGSGAIDNLIYTLKGEEVVVEEDTANVKINIIGVNDLKDGDETAEVDEGSGVTVLTVNALDNTVDVDEGSNPVVTPIVDAEGSNGGSFSIDADGTITFDTNGDFDGLAEGESTTTTITYTVTDGQGGEVESSVTVTVNGVNDLADGDETAEVDEGSGATVLAVNALDNTVDPDTGSNPVVTPIVDAEGSNGGSFSIDADGTITFDTNGDFDGLAEGESTTTTITYTVTDGQGGEVESSVTVTVNGVNDLADGDETAEVDEGSGATVLAVNALDNTVDPDTGSNPQVSPITEVAGSNGGTFSITSDGTITFDTNGDFNDLAEGESTTTTITYTVTDGQGGEVQSSVTVTVNGVNDLADGDETASVFEDAAPTELDNALDNVVDPDSDPANIMVATLAGVALVAGTATADGDNGGSFTFEEDGTVTFSTDGDFDFLTPGQVTTTSITYQVTDGDGGLVTSTYTVEVTGVNDAPVAVANSYAINEGEALTGANIITDPDQSSDVGEVDSDPNGDALVINSALGKDVNGDLTVDIVSDTFVTVYTDGGVAVEVKLDDAGNLEVSENSEVDAAGDQISLTYTVEDVPANGDAKVSNEANVTVSIADVPDPAGPEINVVFVLDASDGAVTANGSTTAVGDLNLDGKADSVFDLSIDVMQDAVANISSALGAGAHNVDIGVYSFESQITSVANEFTPAVALADGSETVFDLDTDFGQVIADVKAGTGVAFGDNGSDIFDNGAAFMAAAMEAANGFISANDQSGAGEEAINLVYVIGTSIGADIGNDYVGAGGPGVPDGTPDGFASIDYLVNLPGVGSLFEAANDAGNLGPDVALTNALLESQDLGLTIDTLHFGGAVAPNSGLFALENFQPDPVTLETALADGTINTDAASFLTGVTTQIDDLLA